MILGTLAVGLARWARTRKGLSRTAGWVSGLGLALGIFVIVRLAMIV
jgi:hypothetical protein